MRTSRRIELKRYKHPILLPNSDNWWESKAVFNPGAIYDDGKFFLLYRAVGEYENYISRFGLAISEDGFNFKRVSKVPVFEGKEWYDRGGCEDARIVKMEGKFYITYASLPRS
ncbi:MAG: glycosidase, partial [Candidatus Alkanophagales archaeon]